MSADIEGYGKIVAKWCAEHVKEQCEASEAAVKRAGSKSARQLRDGSATPHDSGEYAGGWRMQTVRDEDDYVEVVVHNTTRPGLTHLLEDGHELFYMGNPTGRRTRAFKHIGPAYEAAADLLRKASVSN